MNLRCSPSTASTVPNAGQNTLQISEPQSGQTLGKKLDKSLINREYRDE
jgi:hypothetical protein